MALHAGQAGRLSYVEANFSVKEKDEASPSRGCAAGFLNAFILRFAGV